MKAVLVSSPVGLGDTEIHAHLHVPKKDKSYYLGLGSQLAGILVIGWILQIREWGLQGLPGLSVPVRVIVCITHPTG